MAISYLNSDDTVGVYNAGKFYGSRGVEKILIHDTATDVDVSDTVEQLHFSESVSRYVFASHGGRVAVYRAGQQVAVATVAGTELRFTDGTAIVTADAETGALYMGAQRLETSASAYLGPLDTTKISMLAPVTPPTPQEGQTFVLDGSAGRLVQGTNFNDLYDGSKQDTLARSMRIVDPSATDDDLLNVVLSHTNENGVISNVERIHVRWNGAQPSVTAPTFDASRVTHDLAGGTTITVDNVRTDVHNAVVTGAGANRIVAGENVEHVLTVAGLREGGSVDAGSAMALNLAGQGAVDVTLHGSLQLGPLEDSFLGRQITFHTDEDAGVQLTDYSQDVALCKQGRGRLTVVVPKTPAVEQRGERGDGYEFQNWAGVDVISLTDVGGANGFTVITPAEGQQIVINGGGDVQIGSDLADTRTASVVLTNDIRTLRTFSYDDGLNIRGVRALNLTIAGEVEIGGGLEGNRHASVNLLGSGDLTIMGLTPWNGEKEASDAGGILLHGENYQGRLSLRGVTQGSIWSGVGGSSVVLDSGSAAAADAEVIVRGGAGKDELVLDAGTDIKGRVEFYGGDGDDTLIANHTILRSGASIYIDLGAGRDVVTFNEDVDTAQIQGSLQLHFGEGDDLARIAANRHVNIVGGEDGVVRMSGLETMEIGSGARLHIRTSQISQGVFKLAGSGVLQIECESMKDLDLSGVSQGSSNSSEIWVETRTEGARITCGDAPEVIHLNSSLSHNPLEITTLVGFTANNGMDRLFFQREVRNASGDVTAATRVDVHAEDSSGSTLAHISAYGSVKFTDRSISNGVLRELSVGGDVVSLLDALDIAVRQLDSAAANSGGSSQLGWNVFSGSSTTQAVASGKVNVIDGVVFDAGYFVFQGNTYVMASTDGADNAGKRFGDGNDYVVRIAGTDCTAGQLVQCLETSATSTADTGLTVII